MRFCLLWVPVPFNPVDYLLEATFLKFPNRLGWGLSCSIYDLTSLSSDFKYDKNAWAYLKAISSIFIDIFMNVWTSERQQNKAHRLFTSNDNERVNNKSYLQKYTNIVSILFTTFLQLLTLVYTLDRFLS